MKKQSLYPQTVQEVKINTISILIGSGAFAIVFFIIGIFWRYYVTIGV